MLTSPGVIIETVGRRIKVACETVGGVKDNDNIISRCSDSFHIGSAS